MYFSAITDCVDIASRSSARGRHTTLRWQIRPQPTRRTSWKLVANRGCQPGFRTGFQLVAN